MTTPVTLPPSPAPSRADPANFPARADAYHAWLVPAVAEMNAQNEENNAINEAVDAQVVNAMNQVVLAAAQVTTAAGYAAQSINAAFASATSANFKGNWSALTGALNIPASVLHNGQIWQLTANLANVTTATPGVSSSWVPVVNLDIAARAPIAPTLDLNFAKGYGEVYSPTTGRMERLSAWSDLITFNAVAERCYTDAKGLLVKQTSGQPRITYDPVTGAGRGLSVWGQRANLLTYSQSILLGADKWLTSASGTDNISVAPDGTTTAARLSISALGGRVTYVYPTSSKNTAYVFSCYLKAAASSVCGIDLVCSTNGSTNFVYRSFTDVNLATGAASTAGSTGVDGSTPAGIATLVDAGNGWYRLSISFSTYNGANSLNAVYAEVRPNRGGSSGSVDVWGAQLEAGSTASPYIPTTTGQITANADTATITGSNFSKWFNGTEGTFVVVVRRSTTGAENYALCANNGTASERFGILFTSASDAAGVISAGGSSAFPGNGSGTVDTTEVIAMSSGSGFSQFSKAGGISSPLASGTPACTQLVIGALINSSYLNGTIARILYFPRKMDSQLQALSA